MHPFNLYPLFKLMLVLNANAANSWSSGFKLPLTVSKLFSVCKFITEKVNL